MKTTASTRSIFDDDPSFVTEKKKYYPTLGQAWLIPVYNLGVFLLFFIVTAIVDPSMIKDPLRISLWTIALFGSLLLIVLAYSYALKKKAEPDYKLRIEIPSATLLLACPFLILSLYIVTFGIQEWFHLSILNEWDSVFTLIREKPVFFCCMYFLIDPLIQECLLRGVFLDSFLKKYSPTKAILNVAGISFAFSLSPYSFLYSISFSVIACWIYLKTGNLGNTIYIQILCGIIPAVLVFLLQDQLKTKVLEVLNNPAMVGIGAIVGIVCLIILQNSFLSTNKVIK